MMIEKIEIENKHDVETYFDSFLKIKFSRLKYDILMLPVFYHLFNCMQSSKATMRCRMVIEFFVFRIFDSIAFLLNKESSSDYLRQNFFPKVYLAYFKNIMIIDFL